MKQNTTGISLRKYGPVIKCLTGIMQDATVPAEVKLEAAKELQTIYRRIDAAKERQKARDFRWRMAQLEHSAKVKEEGEQKAGREISDVFRQAEERQRRLTGRETDGTGGTGTPGHNLKIHGSV